MTCVVVTRAGEGDVWKFSSRTAADDSPICQFGDAVCFSPSDLRSAFSLEEMSRLMRSLGDLASADACAKFARGSADRRDREHFSEILWRLMTSRGRVPPTDPAEVVSIVVSDRRATRQQTLRVRCSTENKEDSMSDTETTESQTKKTRKPKAEKAERPIPRTPKIADTSVITMAADAEGKPYGKDNNPKRVGSASHTLFEKYEDGMTVAQALEAGISRRALDWDLEKGFIKIS